MAQHQNGLDALAHKASQAVESRLLEAHVVAMDLAVPHSTALGDLVRRLIREDPRTEELKLLKREFDTLREQVKTSFKRFNDENAKTSADNKELFDRIATDVSAIKKQRTEYDTLEKKVTAGGEHIKVFSQRLTALEGRVGVLEMK